MRQFDLDILGLPPTASDVEIKRRYRELAMRYHPDVNDQPGAKEEFIRIHRAYQNLMAADSELDQMYAAYQRKTKKKGASNDPSDRPYGYEEDQREAMRQRARKYAQMHQQEAEEIEMGVFNMLTRGVQWFAVRLFAVLTVVFGVLMFADYLLPQDAERNVVTNKVYYELFMRNTLFLQNDEKLDVPELVYLKVRKKDTLVMEYSPILHEFLGYKIHHRSGNVDEIDHEFNFFTAYPIIPLLFFVPGLIFFYKRNEVRFYLLYFVCLFAYPGLMLHYLIREDKLTHLINFFF